MAIDHVYRLLIFVFLYVSCVILLAEWILTAVHSFGCSESLLRKINKEYYCIKRHIIALIKSCFSCKLLSPFYYILSSNAISNLASTLRQLKSRSLGVEFTEAYSEPCPIFKMVLFAKIVNGFQDLTTFVESARCWQCFEYAREYRYCPAWTWN